LIKTGVLLILAYLQNFCHEFLVDTLTKQLHVQISTFFVRKLVSSLSFDQYFLARNCGLDVSCGRSAIDLHRWTGKRSVGGEFTLCSPPHTYWSG